MAEKVTIIGSGPAGWTAAIYAARANLNPLLFEGGMSRHLVPGGQLMFTTEVENFPGFPKSVGGMDLMQLFREQGLRFGTNVVSEDVVEVDFTRRPFRLMGSGGTAVETHGVIIATGARANWLGLPNEQRLAQSGGGVSACAVCDGALPVYRDKHLAIVGGGDAAMQESIYLTKFASKVTIIHRRDALRASKIMQERALNNPKIDVRWNSIVVDVLGDEFIEAVELEDTKTGQRSKMECGGLFITIGHTPNTDFLKGHLELDAKGYVVCPDRFRTNTSVEGVFAAGDVMDSYYRQAITAAGTGCMAALDAERWLTAQGIE